MIDIDDIDDIGDIDDIIERGKNNKMFDVWCWYFISFYEEF
jgi:hypothetical protein